MPLFLFWIFNSHKWTKSCLSNQWENRKHVPDPRGELLLYSFSHYELHAFSLCNFIVTFALGRDWRPPCWFWWQLCWDELLSYQNGEDCLRAKGGNFPILGASREGQVCTLAVLMNCPSLFGLLMLLSYCILFYTSLLFLFEFVCKVCHSQSQREGSKVYEFISQKLYH